MSRWLPRHWNTRLMLLLLFLGLSAQGQPSGCQAVPRAGLHCFRLCSSPAILCGECSLRLTGLGLCCRPPGL